MKKFILEEGTHRELTGFLISIQLVPRMRMVRNDLEYSIEQDNELHIIYVDNYNEVQSKEIYESDSIKFL